MMFGRAFDNSCPYMAATVRGDYGKDSAKSSTYRHDSGKQPMTTIEYHRHRRSRRRRISAWFRRVTRRRTRACTEALPPPSVTPVLDEARVSHVVDPHGRGVLFHIAGRATHRTIDAIDELAGSLGPNTSVHLDLYDADIPVGPVMSELGRLADRLEHGLVRVRMAGLDPSEPAIDPF